MKYVLFLVLTVWVIFAVDPLCAQLIQERGCCLVPPPQDPKTPPQVVIRVWELTNEATAAQVQETLEGLLGVSTTKICMRTGSVTVQYAAEIITPAQLLESIQKKGFTGLIWPACCLLVP